MGNVRYCGFLPEPIKKQAEGILLAGHSKEEVDNLEYLLDLQRPSYSFGPKKKNYAGEIHTKCRAAIAI